MPAIRLRLHDADRPVRGRAQRLTALAVGMLLPVALTAGTTTYAGAAPRSDADLQLIEQTVTAVPDAVRTPRLTARATLSADYQAGGPPSGAQATPANGRKGPFPSQVLPGFSAALANGDGTYWAMPDNGFGAKTNSADFLLRIYLVKPRWERAGGGAGQIEVLQHVSLSDPRNKITFDLVRGDTRRRLLTGGDFDIESLQRDGDGGFWIGDEFGPYLLHFDSRGRLLDAPVPFPLGGSPQNPELNGRPAATQPSGGFEATAASTNHRYLYPILEKALVGESDPRRRVISQFDTRTGRYTGRTWDYRVDTDANLVADAQLERDGRLLILERDDFDGDAAVTKRVYRVSLRKKDSAGGLAKTLVVDLLKIDNPAAIGDGDGWGTGNPFVFGFQSVETLVPLPNGRLLIANDNNYPGNAARRPGTPDDTEMIIINLRATTRPPAHRDVLVAHRGASGYRPEHTLAAYSLAIRQCADVIEPDVVLTKDGVPVARHENEISGTTDVKTHLEFAGRKTTKTIDGRETTGWFTEDFTLAELRTLRATERLPDARPDNVRFNGKYPIPTLAEVLDLARHSRTCDGRPVGVAPETKHPSYFASIGRPLEGPLVSALDLAGLNRQNAPVVIQSFETSNLQRLDGLTPVQLIQLVDCSGAPYDLVAAGDPRTYKDLATAAGLQDIAKYADAVGFCKNVMIPRAADDRLFTTPSTAIADAHAAGLTVIGWTFRRENTYLPLDYRHGIDPFAVGDLAGEIRTFLAAGMDGFFTDNPDIGRAVVTEPETVSRADAEAHR